MAVHRMDDGCLERALNEYRYGDLIRYRVQVPKEMIFTGYKGLDELIGGMLPGELYLIGARPAMGRSSLTYNLLNRMCVKGGTGTLLFSMDTSADVVLQKMLVLMTGINFRFLRPDQSSRKDIKGLDDAAGQLKKAPLIIEDSVYLTLDKLEEICRKVKDHYPVRMVIIDSWEGIKISRDLLEEEDGEGEDDDSIEDIEETRENDQSRGQEERILTNAVRKLRQIAQKLDLIIFVNTKLSWDIEDREDHYPRAYDFPFSPEALNEAAGILTLYRESYYNHDIPDDEDFLYVRVFRSRSYDANGRYFSWKWESGRIGEYDDDNEGFYDEGEDENTQTTEVMSKIPCSARKKKTYPDIKNADELLKEICISGINNRYEGEWKNAALVRIEKELEIVKKQGSASGYLTVLGDLNAVGAKPEEFYCPGMITSSLLSYASGLSDIEPLNSNPRLYPEFYFGFDGEREPYFELRVTPELQKRLRDYYADYPGPDVVTSIYNSSYKSLKAAYIEDLYSADSMRDLYQRLYIVYDMIHVDDIRNTDPDYRRVLNICKPETLEEYVKCYGLAHGTGAWENVENRLAETGKISFSEMIANREDVYEFLLDHQMDKRTAYEITENVRRGRIHSNGWTEKMLSAMNKADIPEWFLRSCERILYLFQRPHAMTFFSRYRKDLMDLDHSGEQEII